MANIFDLLKRITVTKEDWNEIPLEEQECFNNWLINKFISMNQDYAELVNIVQKNTWQMPHEVLYKLYCDLIPKSNIFLRYIKVTKTKHKPELVESIQEYFSISKKEAKEYLDILTKQETTEILAQQGK